MTDTADQPIIIADPFGPTYPDLGAKVAKSRAAAWRDPAKRREHGENVLAAIRAKNDAALRRVTVVPTPHCASNTGHTTGRAILKAVAEQNARVTAKAYENPLPMAGDPAWEKKRESWYDNWAARCEAVYAAAMRAKRACDLFAINQGGIAQSSVVSMVSE